MKKLLIPLFLFSVALLLSAAPPILRQFGTTNTPTVLTNIIQSLASGGDQIWTNDPFSVIYPVNPIYTNPRTLVVSNSVGTNNIVQPRLVDFFFYNTYGVSNQPMTETLKLENQILGQRSGMLYGGDGAIALNARVGIRSGEPNEWMRFNGGEGGMAAVYANGGGTADLLVGVASMVAPTSTSNTIIGVFSTASPRTIGLGTSIGGYFETYYDNFEEPVFSTNAVLIVDNRDTGYPLFLGRSNQVVVSQLAKDGRFLSTRFKSVSTNGVIIPCPDGGSFIITVKNDGTLNVVTNTTGL